MEEFDSHTEHAQEQAHEAAHESHESWVTGVALTAAILAALAALTSMLSGHAEHEAMMEQIKASDQWNYYQADKLKTLIREDHIDNLKSAGAAVPDSLQKKVDASRDKQNELLAQAKELEESSEFHDHLHGFFGSAVTLFQVAIAVAAISALTRRRAYWYVGITLGTAALGFLFAGLVVSSGALGHRPAERVGTSITPPIGEHAAKE